MRKNILYFENDNSILYSEKSADSDYWTHKPVLLGTVGSVVSALDVCDDLRGLSLLEAKEYMKEL